MHRKPPVSPESALASDVFDQFCCAGTFKSILHHHRHLCEILKVKPTNFPYFYPKLKSKLGNWKAQALWNKFDKRASHKCYNRGKACSQIKVLIIGAGPCGLRAAIEAQLLGARVVVLEKRDRITRNNVLHLWPFVIQDLRSLGAKKFFGRFCAGAIDHISIRQLQCILMKVALIFGVEIHEGVAFESLIPPPSDQDSEKIAWRASVSPPDHPVSQYEFDVLIGADGKRNTLDGFNRKEFRGKLAIAITANFINRRSEAEARVEEISGVAFIFNQKFFKDLYAATGIDLENIVYYKDDTHYFVMTAKKHSLLNKGVILQDYSDTAKLLHPDNVDRDALYRYAKEAADFSTNYMLPDLDFAVNHHGRPDVAMFDFTSMYAAENASRVFEKHGHKLLQLLVGDSLLEPFWPTGSGCARGFLSSMDACWAIKSWSTLGALSPLDVIAERESIYRILGQTTPENLHRDLASYTLDPCTRYPNLNTRSVLPLQIRNLFETDDPVSLELALTPSATQEIPKKRRRKESQVHPDTLLQWLKRQVCLHPDLHVENMTYSFKNGLILCAIISRYRPDLLEYSTLNPEDTSGNNQKAFDILEREFGIPPVMTGEEMSECQCPDRLSMLSYLSQVYDTFRGEIPHIKHPRIPQDADDRDENIPAARVHVPRTIKHSTATRKRLSTQQQRTSQQGTSGIGKLDTSQRKNRKRRSGGGDKLNFGGDRESRLRAELRSRVGDPDEEFTGRIKDIEEKLLRGTAPEKKKPKDLLRAIGKIEKSDWNVREIEKKIEENKYGRGTNHDRPEKVPKWSREQFDDKFHAMEKKLINKGLDQDVASRYAEVDVTLKRLEQKLKEGSALETGERGSNKVSAIAEQFANKLEEDRQEEKQLALQKSSSKGAIVLPTQGGSEVCHFCSKRVYLMERVSAEGKFFHRGCFKCEYCGTTLRQGNYMYDKEGKYGNRFYCNQHFGLPGTIKSRFNKGQEKENKAPYASRTKTRSPEKPKTPTTNLLKAQGDALDRGTTPERIEFENLAQALSDPDEASEMDEDEWTDRNFGASAAEMGSSDDLLDMSDTDDEDEQDEIEEEALMTADETREVAERWTRKHSSKTGLREDLNGQDSCEADDSDDFSDYSEDDDSDTATEGEEEIRALELRKQEVRLEPQQHRHDTDTGSDTEVASDEASTSASSEEIGNSATEISTDSEFEHDNSVPTTRREIPDILIMDHKKTKNIDEPKKVQIKSGNILKNSRHDDKGVKLIFSPLVDNKSSSASNVINKDGSTVRAMPFINPQRGDYYLSKTQSTEGIATKMSLELRKKYLLGNPVSNAISKSGSATALDSRFKSFASNISECQKLLNPGNEISPSMQAFLQTTSIVRTPVSPTINTPPLNLPPSSMLLRKQKELPGNASPEYQHICGKKEDIPDLNVINLNLENLNRNLKTEDEKNELEKIETGDCRPRSPVHETSIEVPKIPWKKDKDDNVESDSLSESETESESTSSENEEKKKSRSSSPKNVNPPPRLEVTNSKGELIGNDDVFEMDSLNPLDNYEELNLPVSINKQIELARNKIIELKNSITQGETDIQRVSTKKRNNSLPDSEDKVLELNRNSVSEIDLTKNTKLESKHSCSLTKLSNGSLKSARSSPVSPISQVDESCHTFAALTETELSDWARDEICVSEDLEDLVDDYSKKKGSKKPKKIIKKGNSLEHICGKDKSNLQLPLHKLLASTENFDFMDTEDGSELESVSATNEALLKNRGYIQFVNEDDLTTPIVDIKATIVESSTSSSSPQKSSSSTTTSSENTRSNEHKPSQLKHGETTEESTTSDPTTIKNSPSVARNFDINDETFYTPLVPVSPISPKLEDFGSNKEYDEYVQRIQGRISPFHNVRDSIDYRKSKQKPIEVTKQNIIVEEKIDDIITDPTTKKLQQISRERSFQKDLVHEMVLNKVLANKKSPGDRKSKRILRTNLVLSPQKPDPVPSNETPLIRTPSSKVKKLPDTPLTNPEAFSMPDIHKASYSDFKTPQPLKTNQSKDTDKIRQEARARARLKSDEELGLSPEDKIKKLRDKANKLIDNTPKRHVETRFKNIDNVRGFGNVKKTLPKSNSTSKVFDKLRDRSSNLGMKNGQKSTSDLLDSCSKENEKSPVSSGPSTSTSSNSKTGSGDGDKKRSRDRERRRSIIQAVSDFFHKKSPSPSKSPSPTKQMGKEKFSAKFRLTPKNKEKKDNLNENLDAPPVPPPPVSYKPSSKASDESGSEGDEAISAPTQGSSTSIDGANKRSRMTRRMARQAQLKRLRMAQEIQRRLEEVEEKQRDLEMRGVSLEKALRGEENGGREGKEEEELLREWFELMRERSELRRYEKELLVKAQEMELEDRHARLQQELRDRLAKDDANKTPEELAEEGHILRQMLETVEKRDSLTALLEQERQRYQEEDKDLEAQMLAKGLRLTPIRKYEYQSSL